MPACGAQFGRESPERLADRQAEQDAIAGHYCVDCFQPAPDTAVYCRTCLPWRLRRHVS